MTEPAIVAAEVLFLVLGSLSLVLPLRWALFSYVLLTQINVSGPEFASASSLGWENAVKVVLIPTILLLRLPSGKRFETGRTPVSRWWLPFVAYVALASLWSPFPLSAVKMVGYLYSYSVLFVLFLHGWRESWFTAKFLLANLCLTLCLGVVQTYLLGGLFSGGEELRFSTFSDGQSMAAYLICIVTLVLFQREKGWLYRVALFAAFCGILLAGSRYVFIGLAILVLLSPLGLWEQTAPATLGERLKKMAIGLLVVLLAGAAVVRFAPENRLNQLIGYATSRSSSYEDVGTFAWRILIYQEAANQLLERSPLGLLVGSGTSSSGNIIVGVYSTAYNFDTVDANRAMHDEFLRALYEWGVVGLLLLLGFLVSTIAVCWRRGVREKHRPALAYLAIFPTLLLGLTIENLLANAGQPAGTGYLLVLTYSVSAA
jgi:O-antigen ligase